MKYGKTFEEFQELNGISIEDVLSVFEAVSQAFPMIVLGNLTKNTYTMLKDDGFLAWEVPKVGCYDELIDYGVGNVHPNYQNTFVNHFSREKLISQFERGKREVYAKIFQKGRGSQYQWVSTHVIRVHDRDGDICELCINKVLEDVQQSGERIGREYY